MSIGSFFKSIFASPAGQSVQAFALSEADKALAVAKTTPQGAQVYALVKSFQTKTTADGTPLTGAQKRAAVLSAALPIVATIAKDALIPGAAAGDLIGAETLARMLIESFVADLAATKPGNIFTAILSLFGMK